MIFLTASVMPSEVERLKKMGARAVVAKPFDPFSLPAAVRELLGTPTPRPPSAAPSNTGNDGLDELRAQFVKRSQARIEMAARLLGLLRETPEDQQQLQELMRFFHSLAGVGTSFGFPQVTALAKEGELECLAVLHDKAALSPTEIENWTRLVGALAHELSQPPTTAAGGGRAGMVTRIPEVLLVSPDAAVAATLAPLIEQEGHSARHLPTRAAAAQALGQSLPDALIVEAPARRTAPGTT